MNSAHMNSAHMNSAHMNSAHMNSAHMNSAHMNSAHMNSAHMNSAHMNSAHMTPGCMTRWLLISCTAIVLALSLGACSASNDVLSRADLAADADDSCQTADGPATGMTALNGRQAAYAQCMRERMAAGPTGFQEGSFAPGSHASSLADMGR
jgi:hypothetical protein